MVDEDWRRVGSILARFHAVGADHADLNAHNILIDEAGTVSVIDFDRGRLRPPGAWAAGNLARLRRSLLKIGGQRFVDAIWGQLLAGYANPL
jgi:3-deoxy-D-manno-octulosonic acid kinase